MGPSSPTSLLQVLPLLQVDRLVHFREVAIPLLVRLIVWFGDSVFSAL
jgi:hypothetical protein